MSHQAWFRRLPAAGGSHALRNRRFPTPPVRPVAGPNSVISRFIQHWRTLTIQPVSSADARCRCGDDGHQRRQALRRLHHRRLQRHADRGPAQWFFPQTEVEPAFLAAAHKLGRPVTVQTARPLPHSDPLGAVPDLLLLPLLIGGYLAAVLVFKAAHGTAAAPWRAAILIGYALVGALVTDLIAGLGIGAYSSSHFWALLPCFWLVTSAVALTADAIQGVAGKAGTLLVAVLFIMLADAILQKLVGASGTLLTVVVIILLGNASSGGATGVPYLPAFWRDIGPYLPPRNAYVLLHHTIYFNGNGTTQALTVCSSTSSSPRRSSAPSTGAAPSPRPADATEAAAMAVPIGAAP